jgi:putative component of toxin-antitoxin plasmid stabilization module
MVMRSTFGNLSSKPKIDVEVVRANVAYVGQVKSQGIGEVRINKGGWLVQLFSAGKIEVVLYCKRALRYADLSWGVWGGSDSEKAGAN